MRLEGEPVPNTGEAGASLGQRELLEGFPDCRPGSCFGARRIGDVTAWDPCIVEGSREATRSAITCPAREQVAEPQRESGERGRVAEPFPGGLWAPGCHTAVTGYLWISEAAFSRPPIWMFTATFLCSIVLNSLG